MRASWHWRAAIGIALGAAAVRLVLASLIPLVPDETYYWEWSRHLAAGYFDHPPAIAFLIHAGVVIFGATPFGVRVCPVLAGLGTVLAVVWLARRVGGDGAALWASVIAACLPLASAGLILATPDAPLLLTSACTLLALDRALCAPPRTSASLAWWGVTGALLGVAFASKYTAVLIPLGVLVAFLARRTLRERLATPQPYLALVVALVVFTPVAIWNAGHGWISFTFQLSHGLASPSWSAWANEGSLLAGQLALASPLLFGLMVAAIVRAVRPAGGERRFLLAVVAATMFLFFVISALGKRVEPNWPGIAYIPAIVVLAVAAARPLWRRWLYAACALGGAMVLAIYVQSVSPVLPFPPGTDPIGRAYGWASLAASVDTARSEIPQSAGVESWVAGDRYQDASELAFHLPEHPTVFSLNLAGRQNQYTLWRGFPRTAHIGDNLVVALTPPPLDDAADSSLVIRLLTPHFRRVRQGALVTLGRPGDPRGLRRIWLLEGWRGSWPATSRAP
ncbi:MAG TPA: glycosyltransferase family 39 protein [Gemmatimonadaceae bacterium]|nr:glycosyltransferase family 39 protein [Gemmatimonadaceae bacterium]